MLEIWPAISRLMLYKNTFGNLQYIKIKRALSAYDKYILMLITELKLAREIHTAPLYSTNIEDHYAL